MRYIGRADLYKGHLSVQHRDGRWAPVYYHQDDTGPVLVSVMLGGCKLEMWPCSEVVARVRGRVRLTPGSKPDTVK